MKLTSKIDRDEELFFCPNDDDLKISEESSGNVGVVLHAGGIVGNRHSTAFMLVNSQNVLLR